MRIKSLPILKGIAACWLTLFSCILLLPGVDVYPRPHPHPHPWEPYSETEQGFSMQQARIYHDTLYTALDVAIPMISKLAKEKYDDYREKYHSSDSKAGKAGKSASEESSSQELKERRRRKKSKMKEKLKNNAEVSAKTPPEQAPSPEPVESVKGVESVKEVESVKKVKGRKINAVESVIKITQAPLEWEPCTTESSSTTTL